MMASVFPTRFRYNVCQKDASCVLIMSHYVGYEWSIQQQLEDVRDGRPIAAAFTAYMPKHWGAFRKSGKLHNPVLLQAQLLPLAHCRLKHGWEFPILCIRAWTALPILLCIRIIYWMWLAERMSTACNTWMIQFLWPCTKGLLLSMQRNCFINFKPNSRKK